MKIADVAARLEVSAATAYALVASGRLRCHRIGTGRGTIRVTEEHLAAYLNGAEQSIAPPATPTPKRQVILRHLTR